MTEVKTTICSYTSEIAAYLDDELSASDAAAFEQHLANCGFCAEKLNEQKRLICSLEHVFDEKDFELPKDFAKKIAVRAEADVSGIKTRVERRRALLMVIGLLVLGAAAALVGSRAGMLPPVVDRLIAPIFVVAEVFGRFCYDIAAGIFSFGQKFFFDAPLLGGALALLLVISFVALSRLLLKFHRV